MALWVTLEALFAQAPVINACNVAVLSQSLVL
jgi:hypothetical protein